MESTTQNNQVAIIQNSLEVLKTGPAILLNNQARKDKALTVGRNILTLIMSQGMSPELDERAMKFLTNVSTANKEMKDERSAVTQIMDQLKKMYTEVENDLDVKKDGSIPSRIQKHRDQYAKQLAEEAEKRRQEAERQAQKAKEAVDLKFAAENAILNGFTQYLSEKKGKLINAFNTATLGNIAEVEAKLGAYTPNYPQTAHQAIPVKTSYWLHKAEEAEYIFNIVRADKYPGFAAQYESEMNAVKQDLLSKIPSKVNELNEQRRLAEEAARAEEEARKAEADRQAAIARANAAEKERLEREAEEARKQEAARQAEIQKQREVAAQDQLLREEEEARKRKEEEEASRIAQEQEALARKQGEETMVMFEKEAAIADGAQAPEARQGFEITVLHPVGYTQLFALWFEKVGKDLPVDKIGNTKLDQMKAWAEKEAHKTGTKIESKFLQYNETFKAVNRKAK